jgi:hypothetical protein
MLCDDCKNSTIQNPELELSELRLVELGFCREIRIAIWTCNVTQRRNEININLGTWNEEKMLLILKNCSTFRLKYDNNDMQNINLDETHVIFSELKREIGFDISMPQLLEEDVSLNP